MLLVTLAAGQDSRVYQGHSFSLLSNRWASVIKLSISLSFLQQSHTCWVSYGLIDKSESTPMSLNWTKMRTKIKSRTKSLTKMIKWTYLTTTLRYLITKKTNQKKSLAMMASLTIKTSTVLMWSALLVKLASLWSTSLLCTSLNTQSRHRSLLHVRLRLSTWNLVGKINSCTVMPMSSLTFAIKWVFSSAEVP